MKKFISLTFLTVCLVSFAAQYKDGTYSAQSSKPYHGWLSVVQVTIKNGEVDNIIIEDFDKDNVKRSDNLKANEELKKDTGSTYSDIVNNFKTQFSAKKNVNDIDQIAGATKQNKIFKNLTKAALINAEKGDTNRSLFDAR
ncbi:MAG: hypothetical protein ACRC54_02355 [Fusobacteriaceae bacterium]